MDHLEGVQHVLQNWGEQKAISDVGLCHSIYGSELFVSLLHGLEQGFVSWLCIFDS